MTRILHKLDPRRSLATAVGWLAVALSVVVTLATTGIGDHTRQRLLADRDALMMRFVTTVAGDLERSLDAGGAAAATLVESVAAMSISPSACLQGNLRLGHEHFEVRSVQST